MIINPLLLPGIVIIDCICSEYVIYKLCKSLHRARAHGNHSKNDSLLKPPYNTSYVMNSSINFKVKSSKSLQIGSQTRTKSLLAMTLNKNSALVNLNNRSQFDTNAASSKYHPNAHSKSPTNNNNWNSNNYHNDRIQNPKTFNPSKQWMDAMLKETSSNTNPHKYKSRAKAISSNKKNKSNKPEQNNGTLTVNNHTFTGIWAKTLPKQPVFPDVDQDDDEDEESKYDDNDNKSNNNNKKKKKKKKGPTINRKNTIHSLFEQKQSQQANNIYAYSVAPKYSAREMQAINNSTE